jgi:hypothetical protein
MFQTAQIITPSTRFASSKAFKLSFWPRPELLQPASRDAPFANLRLCCAGLPLVGAYWELSRESATSAYSQLFARIAKHWRQFAAKKCEKAA